MIRSRIMRAATHRRAGANLAFSLLEILMVVSIILVVTALVVPVVKTAKETAKKSKCADNMRQYGLAFRMYQSDHRGLYPNPWVSESLNWQSYLCGAIPFDPWIGPNVYCPPYWLGAIDATAPPSGPGHNGNGAGHGNNGSNGNGGTDNGIGTLHKTGVPDANIAERIMGAFLCPSVVQKYNIPLEDGHVMWGYTYNYTRVGISYGAAGSPWNKAQYANGDLDWIYPKAGLSAMMTCENNPNFNSDLD